VKARDGKILYVVPDRDNEVNRGQACVKGKCGLDFVHDEGRLKEPMVKKGGKLVPVSWEEALEVVAEGLGRYRGSGEFGMIASAKCTNEDNYVMQKFARVVMGTNDIDHCARL